MESIISTDRVQSQSVNLSINSLWPEFANKLKSQGKSENTLKNYKTDLDCFKNYLLEHQKNDFLQFMGLPQILEYGKYLEARYTSNNSRRRRVQTLRIFFDYLVESGDFLENPVRKIPTSPKFVDIPRPTKFVDIKTLWISLLKDKKLDSELNRLINQRNQIIFLLIYNAGLKVSDLAKLSIHQVTLSSMPRVLITPLNRDPYSIPINQFTAKMIKKYLINLEAEKLKSGIQFSELLFNANPHKILSGGLSSRGIEILMEDYRRKLNIEITAKSLRQAAITNWINLGHNDSSVKEWMGVAPSYSLKDYKSIKDDFFYNDEAIEELYEHHEFH